MTEWTDDDDEDDDEDDEDDDEDDVFVFLHISLHAGVELLSQTHRCCRHTSRDG